MYYPKRILIILLSLYTHALGCPDLDLPHVNHASNAITSVHVVEGLVDAREVLSVGDELVDLQLAAHVVVDEAAHLTATLDTAESAALPHAAGDELECWYKS